MEFRIADTFTDSLARLTGDEQKGVKTTAFDLQINPAQPGLKLHADRLLAPEVADVDGNIEERRGAISVFNGPRPIIRVCESRDSEAEAVTQWISHLKDEGLMPHEFAVFVRSAAQLDRARSAVANTGIPFKILDEEVETTSG